MLRVCIDSPRSKFLS
jgi:hypothetical protein